MIDTVLSACPYILLLSMCSCEIRNTNKSILTNAFNIYRMALTNAERQKRCPYIIPIHALYIPA